MSFLSSLSSSKDPEKRPREIPTWRHSRNEIPQEKEYSRGDTTADILADRLYDWGVDTVFGIVGDGINPVIEALRKRQEKIRFIAVRHEESAAFMASGYSKLTGRLGACLATTGPGAVHLLNGLYDAAYDGASVVAITGSTYQDLIGTHYMQELDTVSLFHDLACYNVMIGGPRHALGVIDLACRSALSVPGVAHLTLPIDVQMQKLSDDNIIGIARNLRGSVGWTAPLDVPLNEELEKAAAVLNEGKKILILAGRGALTARQELEAVAEQLGAPVAQALLGRTALADDSPYSLHGIGHLGSLPSKELIKECDTLLILGSSFPYLDYYPEQHKAQCVQVDRDAKRIGLRYDSKVGLTGDVKETLKLLLPKLKFNEERAFLTRAQEKMQKWRQKLDTLEEKKAGPLTGEYVIAKIRPYLTDDATLSLDCGANTGFSARHLLFHDKQRICVAGNLATMAAGLPYAIAASLVYSDRQSVAIVGDGGLTMLMGELATAVKYGLPIKVIVLQNNTLSMVRSEQIGIGNPTYGVKMQPIDFAQVAAACGAESYNAENAEELDTALDKCFHSSRTCLIAIAIDPKEESLPPERL